jgi:methylmalonyl-CoA/ethylmalonyl-CoA epimerase
MPGFAHRLDHVAIAVDDLGRAWQLYGKLLGGTFVAGGDDTEIGIRVLQVKLPPGAKVELIEPLDTTSYLQGFLDRHGPGFHHMTLIVDDVVAADEELRAAGFATTDLDLHDPQWRETYIRPSSGFGALIQLTDSPLDWGVVQTHITPEQVIAGEVLWVGTEKPRLRTPEDGPPPDRTPPDDVAPRSFGR